MDNVQNCDSYKRTRRHRRWTFLLSTKGVHGNEQQEATKPRMTNGALPRTVQTADCFFTVPVSACLWELFTVATISRSPLAQVALIGRYNTPLIFFKWELF
jgi:hypothetical protein